APDETQKEEDALDEEAIESILSEKTLGVIEAQSEAIATRLAKKIGNAITTARKNFKASDGVAEDLKEKNEIVRNFMKALKSGDVATAKSLGMKAIDTSSDASGADAGLTIPQPHANEILRIASTGYCRA